MKIKILILSIAFLCSYSIIAQKMIPPTNSLQVTGKVANPTTFTLTDLEAFPKTAIKDLTLFNHKGEAKHTLTGIQGVPVKEVLASIKYIYDNPKVLNEFYFVFIASDGYKVVFSWNEIYNTDTGNNLFIVTEMEGKKLKELDQRILSISTTDMKTGRRYIKGLEKIEVRQIE